MVVIVMGVMGAGKTTVGRLLARRLGWPFHDADDLHPPGNVARLRAGQPLGDDERAPWLDELRALVGATLRAGGSAVVACSALRERYRRALVPSDAPADAVRFVHLRASSEVLARRLAARTGHFADARLLPSQLATLEPPSRALVVDADAPTGLLAERIAAMLEQPGEQGE